MFGTSEWLVRAILVLNIIILKYNNESKKKSLLFSMARPSHYIQENLFSTLRKLAESGAIPQFTNDQQAETIAGHAYLAKGTVA